jgi:hypothetical protein
MLSGKGSVQLVTLFLTIQPPGSWRSRASEDFSPLRARADCSRTGALLSSIRGGTYSEPRAPSLGFGPTSDHPSERESDIDAQSAISAMNPRSLRLLARRIRDTGSEMAHRRSHEISEKIALYLEKKAAEIDN